jgi:pyruvate,water dikinase
LIEPLSALSSSDEPSFGGKSASLGELLRAGIPVPPGFAIPAAAMGSDVRAELSSLLGDGPYAVRSSAIGEDSAETTFAGQQETYLWVRGLDDVCTRVSDCWASLYSDTAVAYRSHMTDGSGEVAMGVTIQEMVDAEVSGVMFTCSPTTGDPSVIAVNAAWGLGLGVVGGDVTPDEYVLSKVTGEVVRSTIADKHIEYVPGERETKVVEVDAERRNAPCLSEDQLATLVEIGKRVEKHFGAKQDIEWAFARGTGELFVLQSRPVTVRAKGGADAVRDRAGASSMSLVMGTFGVKRPS